ncbi:GtrA family protein [Neorhizobium sp. NPDC001467]|uniref:GtrA family protein n=1 Tax=Neorhizobium sp. NPDC001467 TaxID=3390595 RepID=UPI003CFE32C3
MRLAAAPRQFATYVLVGLATNVFGYVLYLLLTGCGVDPKTTITVLYLTAAVIGFFANRRFTFDYRGRVLGAGARYGVAQLLGYLINLLSLVLFVDVLGVRHEIVQIGAIAGVAVFLFLVSKLYVFPAERMKAKE